MCVTVADNPCSAPAALVLPLLLLLLLTPPLLP
jgi:hypothetical protein